MRITRLGRVHLHSADRIFATRAGRALVTRLGQALVTRLGRVRHSRLGRVEHAWEQAESVHLRQAAVPFLGGPAFPVSVGSVSDGSLPRSTSRWHSRFAPNRGRSPRCSVAAACDRTKTGGMQRTGIRRLAGMAGIATVLGSLPGRVIGFIPRLRPASGTPRRHPHQLPNANYPRR